MTNPRPVHAPPMAPIPFRKSYSTEEWWALHSVIPLQSSDDKWYTRWDGDWLAWHRAWTGFCVYRLRFEERKGRYHVVEALVCDDNDTYHRPAESYDAALVDWLIQYFLLHRDLDIPLPDGMEP